MPATVRDSVWCVGALQESVIRDDPGIVKAPHGHFYLPPSMYNTLGAYKECWISLTL